MTDAEIKAVSDIVCAAVSAGGNMNYLHDRNRQDLASLIATVGKAVNSVGSSEWDLSDVDSD